MKRKNKRVKNYIEISFLNSTTNKDEVFRTERLTIAIGRTLYRMDKTALGSLRINKYSGFDTGFVVIPVVSNVIEIK